MSAAPAAAVKPINGSMISAECPLCEWIVFRYRSYFSWTGSMVRCPKCMGLYSVQVCAVAEAKSEIECEATESTNGMG